jgi:hypothetical protein
LNGLLSRRCAEDPLVGEIVADGLRQPRANVPLRLFGGAHYLVLAGRAEPYADEADPWPRFRALLEEHREWLREFVAEQPVQTNEVRRCWTLLPGFLAASARGGPLLDVIELGPSAGLNLLWDRFLYVYRAGRWGSGSAYLRLDGDERRPVPGPLLATGARIRRRIGIDRHPVDIRTEHGARLLQAFVWADDSERLERLRRAIDLARSAPDPPELVEGDFVELLPQILERQTGDALTVVFDSHSTEYLDDPSYERLAARLARAGRRLPLAWVSVEQPRGRRGSGHVLELQQWPGGERRRLARVHYHGAELDWLPRA